jgi:hypothetical protein
MASNCAHVNDFCPDAILAREWFLHSGPTTMTDRTEEDPQRIKRQVTGKHIREVLARTYGLDTTDDVMWNRFMAWLTTYNPEWQNEFSRHVAATYSAFIAGWKFRNDE